MYFISGSAVSLESPGGVVQPLADYPAAVSQSLRRCESDIDIISNPSQSSIEILDDVSRYVSLLFIERKYFLILKYTHLPWKN